MQARNMKDGEVPRTIFAHKAQKELQMLQVKAQDEIYLETEGANYEDYQKQCEELELEKSNEFKAIVEESKARMRTIISESAETKKEK